MEFWYYSALVGAAALFALQFLCNKNYQRFSGTGFEAGIRLSILTGLVSMLFFLGKIAITAGELSFAYSNFTFFISLALAVMNTFFGVLGLKVIAVGDLSLYSVFMMLGNIICPVVTGVLFFDEGKDFTPLKGVALAIMVLSIAMSVRGNTGQKLSLKAFGLYVVAFLSNGLNGALYTIHQNNADLTAGVSYSKDGAAIVNSDLFVCWNGITRLGVALVVFAGILLYKCYKNKGKEKSERESLFGVPESADPDGSVRELRQRCSKGALLLACVGFPILLGLCNGVGNYFIAISTVPEALGSLASFPVVNGGTIVFSTLVGLVAFKEKINKWKVVSTALILLATVLFIL